MRAIAVLAILIFHIDPRFKGGFVGVDVFFVISGFLITSISLAEEEKRAFSPTKFYMKRVKRLFPALFLMLFLVGIIVTLTGYYDEVSIFADAATSAVFYVSNLYFYSQNDYFSPDLELNPLLHTWSLSVEEQYYLLFPFFLLFLARRRAQMERLLFALIVFGFIVSLALLAWEPTAAFFWAPSRFWQFLVGSWVAVHLGKSRPSQAKSNVAFWVGGGLVGGSIALISKEMPFPGVVSLAPTLGAALMLFGGKSGTSVLQKIISSRAMCRIGDYSYSLYLWHWPMIVLYKLNIRPTPTTSDKVALFVVSQLVAFVSWSLVEQRCRNWDVFRRGRSTILVLVSAFVVFPVAFYVAKSNTTNPSAQKGGFAAFFKYNKGGARHGKCFLYSKTDSVRYFDRDLCIVTGPKKNVLLVGDSFAAQYFRPLTNLYPEIAFSQATASGCVPTLSPKGKKRCVDLMRMAFHEFVPNGAYDAIVVSARWKFGQEKQVEETVLHLQKYAKDVVIIGPMVEYKQALPKLLEKFGYSRLEEHPSITTARRLKSVQKREKAFKAAVRKTSARYHSVYDRLCPQGRCKTVVNGSPVQYDYGHVTTEGGEWLLRDLF